MDSAQAAVRRAVRPVEAIHSIGRSLTPSRRSVSLVVLAAAVAFLVGLPVLSTEPFFVGVNTAFAAMFVGLGHHLLAQHGERVTGVCFMVAGAGWQVTNLDIYPGWGSVVSWLLGGTIVYTSIGWGVLRFGEPHLDRAGRTFVALALTCTAGTSTLLMLVSRPEWLSFAPESVWLDPWSDPTTSFVAIVTVQLADAAATAARPSGAAARAAAIDVRGCRVGRRRRRGYQLRQPLAGGVVAAR